ncbi:hypothetical protein [Sinorhizobium meliloti]|uniref:hypothetical protein n=1 Tax=Rhizobium meliloti TaxID=382 RepID=UPI000B49A100|nr:hypothetical protein [Sinorhizobium meliloti]ASQ11077.1 hypothetical protein CDO22_13500 [Sinorhizobium meliloti]MQU85750.1 hypothetical protein [Sinorhizobium meliloti]MQU89286.1 hypothetical protein [Sinorhizobium meliloti]
MPKSRKKPYNLKDFIRRHPFGQPIIDPGGGGIFWQEYGSRRRYPLGLARMSDLRSVAQSQMGRRVSEMELAKALVRVAVENERQRHGGR